MDIIKTIFRLSFFLLGCVMLILSLLVIPIGFSSFIWFFSFAILFYLLSYKITFGLIKNTMEKVFKIKFKTPSAKKEWITLKNENVTYNEIYQEITVNEKVYRYSQIASVELIYNGKPIELKELKNRKTFKTLEIKIGMRVNKVSYKKLKYITAKTSSKDKKECVKNAISDFEKLLKLMKTKPKKEKPKKVKTKKEKLPKIKKEKTPKVKKEKKQKVKKEKVAKERKIKLPTIKLPKIKKEKAPKVKKEKQKKIKNKDLPKLKKEGKSSRKKIKKTKKK